MYLDMYIYIYIQNENTSMPPCHCTIIYANYIIYNIYRKLWTCSFRIRIFHPRAPLSWWDLVQKFPPNLTLRSELPCQYRVIPWWRPCRRNEARTFPGPNRLNQPIEFRNQGTGHKVTAGVGKLVDFYSCNWWLEGFSINLKVGGTIYMSCFLNVGGTEEPFVCL